MSTSTVLAFVTLALLVLVVVMAFGWWRAATAVRRGNIERGRIAAEAEDEAEALLASQGFDVLARQATTSWHIVVDGQPQRVQSRADLLVARNGLSFVAEVKTGDRVTRATCPATRRQLMEYERVFQVDGVLLVDMAARVIRRVTFPRPRPSSVSGKA